MIVLGSSRQEFAAYLTLIASEHMGLSVVSDDAALLTANAIADYVKSLPGVPVGER